MIALGNESTQSLFNILFLILCFLSEGTRAVRSFRNRKGLTNVEQMFFFNGKNAIFFVNPQMLMTTQKYYKSNQIFLRRHTSLSHPFLAPFYPLNLYPTKFKLKNKTFSIFFWTELFKDDVHERGRTGFLKMENMAPFGWLSFNLRGFKLQIKTSCNACIHMIYLNIIFKKNFFDNPS